MKGEPNDTNCDAKLGHEPDVLWTKSVTAVGLGLLGLIVLGLIVLYLGISMFASPREIEPAASEWQHIRLGAGVHPNQAADREKVEAAHRAWLNSYGWFDGQHEVAHIPIERAMELMGESMRIGGVQSPDDSSAAGTDQKESKEESP